MFRKDAYDNGESLRTDKNPTNEDAMDSMATLFAPPEGFTFYQASVYYFMIEDEDLDL